MIVKRVICFTLLPAVLLANVAGQTADEAAEPERAAPNADVLDARQWQQLDASLKRGLEWLASQQQEDGSFESISSGQPAVTSFCLMAFLAQGESPMGGKYSEGLTKAVDFILSQQKDNGLIGTTAPNQSPIPRDVDHETVGQPAAYNHAISALALAEVYGQCDEAQTEKLDVAIEKAIEATIEMQKWKGKKKHDVGGWRYLGKHFPKDDSDLSVTGWQLMFLRSAKNSGFDVPPESIEQAVTYVEACFLKKEKTFAYMANRRIAITRAMAGAGVLALAHAGKHDSKMATQAGDWILKHDFQNYNDATSPTGCRWLPDRYHYGLVPCTQAMYQLGGRYWDEFFPPLVTTLLANQNANGSWKPERMDVIYGNCYTTSLCVLSLSAPNQLLPIFQR